MNTIVQCLSHIWHFKTESNLNGWATAYCTGEVQQLALKQHGVQDL
jgi:hypothetical protein